MKTLLKLEESAQFLLCVALLVVMGSPWWVFLLLLIGPDIGMLGYLVGTRTGAFTYNLFHHKAVALIVVFAGLFDLSGANLWSDTATGNIGLLQAGLVLYGHAAMDRIFGFGLKHGDSFQHTHLGWIAGQRPLS